MAATIHLTLEQLAEAVSQLTPEEVETLEILLDPKLTEMLLKRSSEYDELKQNGQLLTLEELRSAETAARSGNRLMLVRLERYRRNKE